MGDRGIEREKTGDSEAELERQREHGEADIGGEGGRGRVQMEEQVEEGEILLYGLQYAGEYSGRRVEDRQDTSFQAAAALPLLSPRPAPRRQGRRC